MKNIINHTVKKEHNRQSARSDKILEKEHRLIVYVRMIYNDKRYNVHTTHTIKPSSLCKLNLVFC